MNTIATIVLTILEALGVVGTLTTLFTAMEKQPVIEWCNSHGSLFVWYIGSTVVFYFIIKIARCILERTSQALLGISSYRDQVIQYLFRFNGDLKKGQVVGIWQRTYEERKSLFSTRKVETGPGRIFAVATVDTFDDRDPKKMTLKHVMYSAHAQKEAQCIKTDEYSEYYMRPYIESEVIDYLKNWKTGAPL